MTDLRAGATNLFLPTLETEAGPKGKFLEAIRKAAAGEFEILGELGRRPEGDIAYLARDLVQPRLVALRLERQTGASHNDYVLNVLQELDGSLPASGSGCVRCGQPLRGWGRFCPSCGYDLSGLDTSGIPTSTDEVEKLAKDLLGEECRVLGRMRRSEGAGTVVFAKPATKDTIVGLRLKRGEGGEVSMDQATEMNSLSDAMDLIPPAEPTEKRAAPIPSREPPTIHADAEVLSRPNQDPVVKDPAGTPPSQISWKIVALIVAATLTVGIVLGVLLGR